MSRTSKKHLPPSEYARRGRTRNKLSDDSLRGVGKSHKQRRAAERSALRKEQKSWTG